MKKVIPQKIAGLSPWQPNVGIEANTIIIKAPPNTKELVGLVDEKHGGVE
jgi:hypothetical protein